MIKENSGSLNLIATELTLGPPRCQSSLDEKNPSKDRVCSSSPVDQHPTANDNITPAAKAQVAGWPPVKVSKCTEAATPKTNIEVSRKQNAGVLFVKVSMYGAPFQRKVDLRSYSTYQELSSALQKMFSCFTLGTCATEETSGNSLTDRIQSSEHVLTFEDMDGDWMLVGDVPWEMFIESCKKLKIMKTSDAIGLAPGAS